ncbi:MAG: hypothetical protein U1F98_13295 [Verrucomicrobiota bacterium]
MDEKERARYHRARVELCDRLAARADEFKVCHACWSIWAKSASVCSCCGSYRWLDSPEYVIRIARRMKKHPWPIKMAVVSRDLPVGFKKGEKSYEQRRH